MDIDVSLAEVDREIISNKKKMTLFAVLAILGISLTIGLFVQRFVSRPVKHLLEGTERVSAGDLSTPLDISSTNEIGTLARSFDLMTRRKNTVLFSTMTPIPSLFSIAPPSRLSTPISAPLKSTVIPEKSCSSCLSVTWVIQKRMKRR
jgi:HAMP domain-containing protein